MTKRDEQLLTILARTDAIFWPIRKHDVPGHVLFCERRWGFPMAGVPWASGALTEGTRKIAQRELEDLASAKLVVTFKPRAARTLGVKLTDEADDALRRRIGMATYADALPILDELFRLRDDGDGCDGLGCGRPGGLPWASEQRLTGVRWGDNANRGHYVLLTEDLFPLLWRGLVASNSSVQGHVWYAPTAAGYELAQERAAAGLAQDYPPPPPEAGDVGAYDFYHGLRQAEIAAIEAGRPAALNEIGDIPLPVCPILRKWYVGPEAEAVAKA